MRRRFLPLVAVALWALGIQTLQLWDSRRAATEYLSVPPAGTARAVGAGFDNVMADGLYLQFIYYFGRHMKRDTGFFNLNPVLGLITDLDPKFEDAYIMGAMALSDNGQVKEAEALLAKGVRANPDDWRFAYDAGMNLFLFGDKPEQYLKAAEYFKKAASFKEAPDEARFMEARMYTVTGRRELMIAVWKDTYLNSPSKEARAVAERALTRLGEKLPGAMTRKSRG